MSRTVKSSTKTVIAVLLALVAAAGLGRLLRAEGPHVPSNTWAPVSDMTTIRAGASSTLLGDGDVLIAGGIDDSGVTASVERFTPAGGNFLEMPPMQTPRANHTATLLADGRVLVVGGSGVGGPAAAAAELYDPPSRVWSAVGSLNVARRGHTATLLADGRVLVAGGDDGQAIDSLEVFDPATAQFTLVEGALSAPRTLHAAAALLDGRVLIAGGYDGANPVASTNIFDPETGAVSAGPDLSTPRSGLTATTLLDGKVLVAGGAGPLGELGSAEIFDPSSNSLTATDNALASPRQNHLAFLLPHNNQVLIVGGLAGGSPVAAAEYFTPWEGTNGTFCAQEICFSGYAGPAAPGTARAWATGSALSFPADMATRTGPADGLLVLAGGSGQTSAELFGFATVKTDREDYAPGTTVTITGSGWQPHESVALILKESPTLDEHPLLDVEADDNGNITSTEFVPDEHDIGIRFYLTAYGVASQAQTTFRDSVASVTITSPTTGSPQTITSLPATVTVNFTYVTSTTGTTTAQADILGTLVPVTGTKSVAPSANGSDSIVLTVPAGTLNGNYNVKVTVNNSTGAGANSRNDVQNTAVIVNIPTNTAPTVTLSGANSPNEGQTNSYTFSTADPDAGETFSLVDVTCGANGTISNQAFSSVTGAGSFDCTFPDGPASSTVSVQVSDGDASDTKSIVVTISNVAPTGTLGNNGPVNEGSPVTVGFSGQSDPSSTDTAAGFHYAFSCDNGSLGALTYGASGSSSSTTCTYPDNGSQTVRARIIDQNDGFTEYTTDVTVNSVAPTATFNAPATGSEGTALNLSLDSPSDPSSADTTAGFEYAFDCGAGYGSFSGSASASCMPADSGSLAVRGKIRDKDGGETEYSATVAVANVAPTGTLSNSGPVNEGSPVTASFSGQSDASSADTAAGFHYAYACDNGSLALSTYAGSGASASTTCTYPDDGSRVVRARIIDKDNGFTEYTTSVTVNNVAPTISLSGAASVDEGSLYSLTLGSVVDPGTDTVTSYVIHWGDGNSDSFAGLPSGLVKTHAYDDGPNGYTINIDLTDEDGTFTNAGTKGVTVNNVAPSATFNAPGTGTEGTALSLSLTGPNDPSSADTSARFEYAFDCGSGYGPFNATSSTSCTPADSGAVAVKGKIKDKDGGEHEYTASVDVANVAPTGTLSNNGPVNEGSPVTVSFSAQFDPSSADTSAGFHYAYACDNGLLAGATYAGSGTSATTTCTYPDNGSQTVRARIIDKDGGYTEYTTAVTVNNVAPTATLSNNGPVNEGSPATVTFSAQFDPSSADTTTGFHYAYACNNGTLAGATYAASGTSASTTCTYPDNGPQTVRARIIDKDGGYTEYTTAITVNNVSPSVTASFGSSAVSCGTESAGLNITFTDPGSADTFSASINWGDGSPVQTLSNVASPRNVSHTYAVAGPYNATVTVTDDDGGSGSDLVNAVTVNLTVVGGGIQPPIRQDGSSIFKSKSTIPAKIQLQNCDGSFSSTLAPNIRFYQTGSSTPVGIEEIPLSTSATDTTGVMRYTGSPDTQYIYNLAAKQLPDSSAAYLLEITIPLTGQKIYANFGLKP